MIQTHPATVLQQWVNGAQVHKHGWRRRKHLRDTFSAPVHDALEDLGDETMIRYVGRLFSHPYFSFEPRPDTPGKDEQTAFVESDSFITIAVGGNGSGKTFTAAQRCVEFLATTEPPRKDTPFWVIADTLEEATKSCWAQKLGELFPPEWIDWPRIIWYREKLGWPLTVPLRSFNETGRRRGRQKNWTLTFKSYEQGRSAFQAEAIGGAWFTEQFPTAIFDEVIRGTREIAFPGAVWAEFTPVDPAKSVEMEQCYESWQAGDESYEDWRFVRLNTRSAVDYGHADKRWLRAFSARMSDEMAAVRLEGEFAGFEGRIYPQFARRVHTRPVVALPRFARRIRGIDWGAGEENAFVMLSCWKDSAGVYWIDDEYYSTDQTMTWTDHAREIKAKWPWDLNDPTKGCAYAPPDRPDLIRLFSEMGIRVSRAKCGPGSVYEGIEIIRTLLQTTEPLGEPRIIISREKCPNLVEQMLKYRWKKSNPEGLNPQDARPEPLKKDDHAVDALRYMVATDHLQSGGGVGALPAVVPNSGRYGILGRR